MIPSNNYESRTDSRIRRSEAGFWPRNFRALGAFFLASVKFILAFIWRLVLLNQYQDSSCNLEREILLGIGWASPQWEWDYGCGLAWQGSQRWYEHFGLEGYWGLGDRVICAKIDLGNPDGLMGWGY